MSFLLRESHNCEQVISIYKASEQRILALYTTTAPAGDAVILSDMFDVGVL
jgi:hypothetical protein